MKDDVKIIVPNGTPKTLIPLVGVVNWDGVLKSGVKLEGDQCNAFLKLDGKNCCTKFGLEVFISRYN
jgi:hypothetical protein